MQLHTKEILIVGGRISSDILGAQQNGLGSVLVKTGEFQESFLDSPIHLDFIVQSISEVQDLLK